MERKAVSEIVVTLLLIGMWALAFSIQPVRAEPKTWYVDDDGGKDFTRIQDAINAASMGDTIFVYNGIYNERLSVYKSLTIIGEDKTQTIVDGSGFGPVIGLHEDYVTVSGFTFRNAGLSWFYSSGSAVLLSRQFCTVSNSMVSKSRYGITSYLGSKNTVSGNTVTDTNQGIVFGYSNDNVALSNFVSQGKQVGSDPPYGIQVWEGDYNTVIGNTITNISYTGIRLSYSAKNLVMENTVSNTSVGIAAEFTSTFNTIAGNNVFDNDVGIEVYGQSNNNTITQNKVSNNNVGIRLGSSLGTIISHNNITDNKSSSAVELYYASYGTLSENRIENNIYGYGVWLYHSAFNTLSKNSIQNNGIGIGLDESSSNNALSGNDVANNLIGIGLFWSSTSHNTISGNNIINNSWFGVYIGESSNNKLYHNNFIGNTQQAYTYESVNTWDDGYPSGGNYWSDYTDVDLYSGPNQDLLGSDAIWDNPYVIDTNNQDRYPLVKPWTLSPTELIHRLMETLVTWNLPKGTENSLKAKLEDALHLLDIGNENGATHKIMEFMSQVEALRGKKLTNDQADYLIAEAQKIIDLIEQ